MIFKDKDGFHYRHPERDCKKCSKYPCFEDLPKLKGNFAKYGCLDWEDSNLFDIKCKR